jgi:hypothetical protein
MYLYLQQHIEEHFNLTCARGDAKILTVPLLDKIKADISSADVIIADCTGRNPNVFYELGMAHILNKPVILITSDAVEQAPADIRCFEFIRYELDDHRGFLEKLDNALRNILAPQFKEYYQVAVELFQKFCAENALMIAPVAEPEFVKAASSKLRMTPLPALDDKRAVAMFTLPTLLPPEFVDVSIMVKIQEWIQKLFGPGGASGP